ncbi:MAG: hypothetical protein J0M12_11330 [Deltaproteobacteria bacterium]|nr:hypothetical protein [Deltaproteobacteria bacterium]
MKFSISSRLLASVFCALIMGPTAAHCELGIIVPHTQTPADTEGGSCGFPDLLMEGSIIVSPSEATDSMRNSLIANAYGVTSASGIRSDTLQDPLVAQESTYPCPEYAKPIFGPTGEQIGCLGPDPDGIYQWRVCSQVFGSNYCAGVKIKCNSNGRCVLDISAGFGQFFRCVIEPKAQGIFEVTCRKSKLFGPDPWEDPSKSTYAIYECEPGIKCICLLEYPAGDGPPQPTCLPLRPHDWPFADQLFPLIPGYTEAELSQCSGGGR